MDIKRVAGRKKEYLGLLLLADEQENMVDRYLDEARCSSLMEAECFVDLAPHGNRQRMRAFCLNRHTSQSSKLRYGFAWLNGRRTGWHYTEVASDNSQADSGGSFRRRREVAPLWPCGEGLPVHKQGGKGSNSEWRQAGPGADESAPWPPRGISRGTFQCAVDLFVYRGILYT